jgi:leucyl-tRNA---protein transferase
MAPVNEYFYAMQATPAQMDRLWASGWRHFGVFFFRYSHAPHQGQPCQVLPLRLPLANFTLSRSQRRILKKNADLQVVIRDTVLDTNKEALFYRHRQRFRENVPDSLHTFLSPQPAYLPCHNQEIVVYENDRLVAVSFLDIGLQATSAVYAMFEPAYHPRSLGIFTMLLAIQHSQHLGCKFYYPGYAYQEASFYDYKKRFKGLEYFDWAGNWLPLQVEEQSEAIPTNSKENDYLK